MLGPNISAEGKAVETCPRLLRDGCRSNLQVWWTMYRLIEGNIHSSIIIPEVPSEDEQGNVSVELSVG